MSIPTGAAFTQALEKAGVISDLNSITRVVIDIQPGDLVRVYVERVGDKRLLDAFKGQLGHMLADATPEPEYVPEHAADCALMLPHAAADCRPAPEHARDCDRRTEHPVPGECLHIHPAIDGPAT